jgi:hypothetical protein
LFRAEEDVTTRHRDADGDSDFLLGFRHARSKVKRQRAKARSKV